MLLGTSAPDPDEQQISSRVQAVVSLYGPSDLAETVQGRQLNHDPVWLFLGQKAREDTGQIRSASPIHQVTKARCSHVAGPWAGRHVGISPAIPGNG